MGEDYNEPMFGVRSFRGRSEYEVAFPLLYMAILRPFAEDMKKPVPILIGSAKHIGGKSENVG